MTSLCLLGPTLHARTVAILCFSCIWLHADSAIAQQSDGASRTPSISGDGRYIAFASDGSNLSILDDTNGVSDIFVRDTMLDVTSRVSLESSGAQANDASYNPVISDDGLRGVRIVRDQPRCG